MQKWRERQAERERESTNSKIESVVFLFINFFIQTDFTKKLYKTLIAVNFV